MRLIWRTRRYATDNLAFSFQGAHMPELYDATTLLTLQDKGIPLLDVRSPGEFRRGHIPGAINLPVLSDEERAMVGTTHARSGTEAAVSLGLSLVGPHLAEKLATARKLTRNRHEALLYCWRGGMRSSCMAWLLETGGFRIGLLRGGYKAYRTLVRNELEQPFKLLVLSGMTGCGKTDILNALAARGKQVLDLEALARHRGSAFGSVAFSAEQPRNEHVENMIHARMRAFNPECPIWVEDEDRHIGTVTLAEAFFKRMRACPLIVVDLPRPMRIQRLVGMYAEQASTDELLRALEHLEKRLGSETRKICAEAIRAGRHADAATLLLNYYDKAYAHQIEARADSIICRIQLERDNPRATAQKLELLEEHLLERAMEKGFFTQQRAPEA